LLRAWIDQGAVWDNSITFARLPPNNLKPRLPEIPPGSNTGNPIDRFLQPYFAAHGIEPLAPVNDHLFARRVYLDVTGLLPPPADLESFVDDNHANKRQLLVQHLLADNDAYAQNWLTFWNDLLRNDYKGTGFIDGGRKQITACFIPRSDQPAFQPIRRAARQSGRSFRGLHQRDRLARCCQRQSNAANAGAQNISQVFMGVNLKCASCHDSFVNDFTLADAYGLASVYAEAPLEMVRCDKPIGKKAELHFIYPELGNISQDADKPTRLKQLARLLPSVTMAVSLERWSIVSGKN